MLSRGAVVMQNIWIYFLMAAFVPAITTAQEEQQPAPKPDTTVESPDRLAILLDVQGPIGPATMEFLVSSLNEAASLNAELVIIRLDTPGGLDASTRGIIKAILNSPVPVATFVAPEGARAASAGTYILYASHIAAMSPATNVGAATPVNIIGGKAPGQKGDSGGDEEDSGAAPEPGDTMSRKAINDAVAYVRGLANKRGRNADWAELAVREAASITGLAAHCIPGIRRRLGILFIPVGISLLSRWFTADNVYRRSRPDIGRGAHGRDVAGIKNVRTRAGRACPLRRDEGRYRHRRIQDRLDDSPGRCVQATRRIHADDHQLGIA